MALLEVKALPEEVKLVVVSDVDEVEDVCDCGNDCKLTMTVPEQVA